ncbi:YceI family protein [Chromatiaceae bacterium AAb-1]|nr:YceI family protein [Chromatiaceae bacterium AAb-1]
MKGIALLGLVVSSFAASANWQLDNSQSSLDFVSVKNDIIAETSQFSQLEGEWLPDGSVNITIPVSSLQTHVPIRDERIWEFVLDAEKFPKITATAKVSPETVSKLAAGQSTTLETSVGVTLLTETVPVNAKIKITRLTTDTILVNTIAPLMLNTDSFTLTAGVSKLQQLAGLTSISPLVPVNFSVTFRQAK